MIGKAVSRKLVIRYWPLAILACAAVLLLAAPAAYAGAPGASGDLYVLTPDEVRQYDGQTYAFVDSFVVDASVREFTHAMRFGGAQDNSLFVSYRDWDAGCHYGVREYDAVTGQSVRIFAQTCPWPPLTLLFAANGDLLGLDGSSPGRLMEFDSLTAELLLDLDTGIAKPRQGTIGPNGNLFAVSWDDGAIVEYDLDTHTLIGPIVTGLTTPIAMTIGPNGNFFVAHLPPAGAFQRVSEYDGTTGAFVRVVVAEGSSTPALEDGRYLSFGPNGNIFATSAIDGGPRGILEFNPTTGDLVAVVVSDIGFGYGVQGFTWKPNMTPTYPVPQIAGFASDPAGNCNGLPVTATVSGTGLVPGAALRLTMSGQPDLAVTPTLTGFDPDTSITAEFIPGAAAPGWWDLELTYPDAQSGTLVSAVEIIDETPCSPPVVSGFAPPSADNCSVLRDAVISGDGFFPGTTVTLVRAGQPDIAGDITDLTLTSITADFQLIHADPGLWDLVVTDPPAIGGVSTTLPSALDVQDVADCRNGAVGDLYAAGVVMGNILQFDGMTGEFVCIFAERPPDLADYQFLPFDLLWAPNGNLWVTSTRSGGDCVVEYDGQTGAFLGYIVPLALGSPPGVSLSMGGPNGNLYLPEREASWGDEVYEFDRITHENVAVRVSPSPPMEGPGYARFLSNGNYLMLGQAGMSPLPTVREYDPSTIPFTFVRDLVVESISLRAGVIETPDGCCYLLTELAFGQRNVDQYDIATGTFLGEVIPRPECLYYGPGDPLHDPECYFNAIDGPCDLAYGPNGHLYVSGEWTPRSLPSEPPYYSYAGGAIHEFDPVTFEQIQCFGGQEEDTWPPAPDRIYQGAGIEFKPLPGDYASAGGAFNGDWVVDLDDFAKFAGVSPFSGEPVFTGPNVPGLDAHALLSFDFDRDNDIDLADFAAFQRAFGTSLQSTGACCNADGTCTDDTWPPLCTAGGAYQGDASTCGAVTCPPVGACCLPDTTCAEMTSNGCAYGDGLIPGVYQGDFTTCGGVVCPAGACCDPDDGTCTDRSAAVCAATGGTYQGDATTCGLVTCPSGQYSNEIDPMTSVALAGAGLQIADDMTLEGTGARDLVFMDLRVYGNGGGAFDVTVELWTDCPGSGGTLIPNTTFDWIGVPDDGFVYTLQVDPLSPAVTIPDTVWMTATFSTAESGWIIAEQAETGTTANVYGWNNPWTCNQTFGGSYAGLWANLRCVEGSSKRFPVGDGQSQLHMLRLDEPAELRVEEGRH